MSSTKTLKIKRVFAWAIYDNLKRIAPKEYPTTGEIKSTISDILPALKQHVAFYVEKIQEAIALGDKVVAKELTEDELKAAVDKINDDYRAYGKKEGQEIVEIALDDEAFKTLKTQFDREDWGKQWLANIEEFGELLAAFDAAEK